MSNCRKKRQSRKPCSDICKRKIFPTPKGKMGVVINMLYDQDINCKSVSYEVVTKYGATAGSKRKRVDGTTETDDESGKADKQE